MIKFYCYFLIFLGFFLTFFNCYICLTVDLLYSCLFKRICFVTYETNLKNLCQVCWWKYLNIFNSELNINDGHIRCTHSLFSLMSWYLASDLFVKMSSNAVKASGQVNTELFTNVLGQQGQVQAVPS